MEKEAIKKLIKPLSPKLQQQLESLWSEYNKGETREAKLVKALDKIETIIQHNQGANPPNFDYQFNLNYGREYSTFDPTMQSIRELIDKETYKKIIENKAD
ncbi:HD domain-containing protein [Robertmurraya andreesenii]|uniref:5'-deoxynucleotidase YfbR-like HD superfamily hydrolase n=1 Tax=Anoxybacillus andreesenii TaxID=1325932 RepID=A0ABT9V5V1_9BACL|nr:HD domain-containing protein [Robertmurraya andreesenii]MDQ0156321.1 5'-deoxynucleotidase YfbR-like HD superfamily hydrolase [Robertmurraya andreesenii]